VLLEAEHVEAGLLHGVQRREPGTAGADDDRTLRHERRA
jgi:hypothetical protein